MQGGRTESGALPPDSIGRRSSASTIVRIRTLRVHRELVVDRERVRSRPLPPVLQDGPIRRNRRRPASIRPWRAPVVKDCRACQSVWARTRMSRSPHSCGDAGNRARCRAAPARPRRGGAAQEDASKHAPRSARRLRWTASGAAEPETRAPLSSWNTPGCDQRGRRSNGPHGAVLSVCPVLTEPPRVQGKRIDAETPPGPGSRWGCSGSDVPARDVPARGSTATDVPARDVPTQTFHLRRRLAVVRGPGYTASPHCLLPKQGGPSCLPSKRPRRCVA
jgi:hypothetical protein